MIFIFLILDRMFNIFKCFRGAARMEALDDELMTSKQTVEYLL